MHHFILFLLAASVFMAMHALQTDEEIAMHALFQAKHAVNRAAHAAAQQLDQDKLALGVHSIDEGRAQAEALRYLQDNLRLDTGNIPIPGSFWKTPMQVLSLVVINEDHVFPFVHLDPLYRYSVTLNRPGVILIVRLEFPRTFRVLAPIVWEIKGTAELVY